MVEDSEIFDSIECEEMEDGSLTLHIPENIVQRIIQAFIENALFELIKENSRLKKENKDATT
jgi:hypothetical protein